MNFARKGRASMLCTIGDAAKRLGVPASTLRYYDKEGLLPHVNRSDSGIRMFTEDDFEWVVLIERLKQSGLSIKEIKRYVDLYLQGDDTLEARRELIYSRRAILEQQMADLQQTLDFLKYKCWFYDRALEDGTDQHVKQMGLDDLPPEMREIKMRCGVNKY